MLSRIPIRRRLTSIFAIAATVLVVVLGLAVHALLARSLTGHVHDGLRRDARSVGETTGGGEPVLRPDSPALLAGGVGFAEIIGSGGGVLAATPARAPRPVLGPGELARARREPLFVRAGEVPGIDAPALVLAQPLEGAHGRLRGAVVVVGGSLADRDAALQRVDTLLLVGGPLVVLLLSLAAYRLAGAALAPVSAMRREAALLADPPRTGVLPLPSADDEIRDLGITLNALLAEIGALVDRERAFLAEASHELRTPLAILTHELELADRPSRTDQEVRDAVSSGLEETRLLVRISEDLLLLARADAGESLLQAVRPLDADDLLQGVCERFAPRAQRDERRIEISPSGVVVAGADLRLQQAVGNLVDNALRHGAGDVEVGARELDDGRHALFVRDGGGGMSEELLGRAFERFARGSDRSGDGTGLGLAIVRSIARAHGGETVLRNRDQGGLEASIVLPGQPAGSVASTALHTAPHAR